MSGLTFGRVVLMQQGAKNAKMHFKALIKPQRPPMPGTATPAGYVVHRKPPPDDATPLERFRDWLLDLGTKPIVAYIQLVWLILLGVDVIIFVGCILYAFDWGYLSEPVYHCTTNSTCCECVDGTYRVLVEDYWQEITTQVMSALFTYSTLLAVPWRVAILHQVFSQRCHSKTGVDFYGRPNWMPFFHIGWGQRVFIAVLLNLAVVCQLVHQVLHFVWIGPIVYFEKPQGQISLITGPVAGIITGVGAGLTQFMAEDRLHAKQPHRFPPSLISIIRKAIHLICTGQSLSGLFKEAPAEAVKVNKASAAHPQSTTPPVDEPPDVSSAA